jgi:pyruvate-ferredoxin/flavodoxin oxidoreductase
MIDEDLVLAHRARALNPEAPGLRGTAQNPDVSSRPARRATRFTTACPGIVQETMDKFCGAGGPVLPPV